MLTSHVGRSRLLGLMALVAAGLLILTVAPAAKACPLCSDNLPNGSVESGLGPPGSPVIRSPALAQGFYYSILLMLFVPYAVVGGGGYYIWRMTKKRRAALQPHDAPAPAPPAPAASGGDAPPAVPAPA